MHNELHPNTQPDGSGSLQVQVLTTREELEKLKQPWSRLLAQSDANTIFLTPEWILTWIDQVCPSAELLCVAVFLDDELVGIAPFYIATVTLFKLIRGRCLRVIGDADASSEYLDIIAHPEVSDICLRHTAEALMSQRRRWEFVWVPYIAQWRGSQERFCKLFEIMNLITAEREISYYALPLDGGEDAYWSSLTSKQRNNIRRYEKRLVKEGALDFVNLADKLDSASTFKIVEELHTAHWNAQGDLGAFERRPAFGRFTRAFMKLAAEHGWLRVFALMLDDIPIAIRFGYSYGSTLYEIQAGFLPKFNGSGLLCTNEAIRRAVQEGLSEYDFLAHGGEYKSRFGANERAGTRYFAARRTILAKVIFRAGVWPTGRYVELENKESVDTQSKVMVLIVVSNLEFGGAQRQIIELVNNIDHDRFNIHICSLSEHIPLAAQFNDDTTLHIINKSARFDIGVVLRLSHLIRQYRFDIVHSFLFDAEIASRLAAGLCSSSVKVVGSERNADYALKRIQRTALKLTKRMVDLIIANSTAGATFNAELTGLPPDRYRVIYNGVNTARFQPADPGVSRQQIGLSDKANVIGMFASFKEQKNHLFLLDVLAEILPDFPDLRLLLVGEELHGGVHGSDAYRSEVLRKITETDLRDITVLAGNRVDVEAIYPACDFTVLPSRHEGLPNVLLESMSCGVPVVATRVSDNEKIVVDGITGLLIDLDDRTQLRSAIVELLTQPTRCKALGTSARAWVLENFSSKTLAEKTCAVYCELDARHRTVIPTTSLALK